jgi:hypothetical protein
MKVEQSWEFFVSKAAWGHYSVPPKLGLRGATAALRLLIQARFEAAGAALRAARGKIF